MHVFLTFIRFRIRWLVGVSGLNVVLQALALCRLLAVSSLCISGKHGIAYDRVR